MEMSGSSSSSSGFESIPPYIVRKVEFVNVQDQYCYDEDLICEYILIDHVPQEHDRVSIYKIGWAQVKEYVLFEWAPLATKEEVQRVVFNRPSLPKNSSDLMFHFCYISAENQVLGASAPFQFSAEVVTKMHTSIMSLPNISIITDTSNSHEKDKEIAKLKEENALLKDTLKMIVQNNKNGSGVQKELEELKNIVKLFQKALQFQESEIDHLKKRLSEQDKLKTTEKLNSLNIIDVGELETLPPFPKYNM